MKVEDGPDKNTLVLEMEDDEADFFIQDAIDRIRKTRPKEQIDYLINYVVNEILREQLEKFKEANNL